jgi:hypothetical protein
MLKKQKSAMWPNYFMQRGTVKKCHAHSFQLNEIKQ